MEKKRQRWGKEEKEKNEDKGRRIEQVNLKLHMQPKLDPFAPSLPIKTVHQNESKEYTSEN